MKVLSILMLLSLLLLAPATSKAEAVVPACPAGYERGYVWTDCAPISGEGCYGIRDNGITNSVISCPMACCEDDYGGYVEWRIE